MCGYGYRVCAACCHARSTASPRSRRCSPTAATRRGSWTTMMCPSSRCSTTTVPAPALRHPIPPMRDAQHATLRHARPRRWSVRRRQRLLSAARRRTNETRKPIRESPAAAAPPRPQEEVGSQSSSGAGSTVMQARGPPRVCAACGIGTYTSISAHHACMPRARCGDWRRLGVQDALTRITDALAPTSEHASQLCASPPSSEGTLRLPYYDCMRRGYS